MLEIRQIPLIKSIRKLSIYSIQMQSSKNQEIILFWAGGIKLFDSNWIFLEMTFLDQIEYFEYVCAESILLRRMGCVVGQITYFLLV